MVWVPRGKESGGKGAIFEITKTSAFSTNNQGLHHFFLTMSWDHQAKRDTPDTVLVSLLFRKQHLRWGLAPLKVAITD